MNYRLSYNFVIFLVGLLFLIGSDLSAGELTDAIVAENPEKAMNLINAGADINQRDESGASAVYLAALRGQKAVLLKLISSGADINALADNGENALHPAVDKERYEIVRILLEAGIQHSIENKYGDTPLDFLGHHPHRIKKLLEEHGEKNSSK